MGLRERLLMIFLARLRTSFSLKQNYSIIMKQKTEEMLLICQLTCLYFSVTSFVAIPNFHGWQSTQQQKTLMPRPSPTIILVCCWLTSFKHPYLVEKSSLAISMAERQSGGGKEWLRLEKMRNSSISLVTVELLSLAEMQQSICVISLSCSIFGISMNFYKIAMQLLSQSLSYLSQQPRINLSININKFLQHFYPRRFLFNKLYFTLNYIRFTKTTAHTAPLNLRLSSFGLYFFDSMGRRNCSRRGEKLDKLFRLFCPVQYIYFQNLISSQNERLTLGAVMAVSYLKSYFFLSERIQVQPMRAFYILFLWTLRWFIWQSLLSISSIHLIIIKAPKNITQFQQKAMYSSLSLLVFLTHKLIYENIEAFLRKQLMHIIYS